MQARVNPSLLARTKTNTKEGAADPRLIIIFRHHRRLHLLPYSICATDLCGRSIVSKLSADVDAELH